MAIIQISVSSEELEELNTILTGEVRRALVEERRSEPNSDFRKASHRRLEVLQHLQKKLESAAAASPAAG